MAIMTIIPPADFSRSRSSQVSYNRYVDTAVTHKAVTMVGLLATPAVTFSIEGNKLKK